MTRCENQKSEWDCSRSASIESALGDGKDCTGTRLFQHSCTQSPESTVTLQQTSPFLFVPMQEKSNIEQNLISKVERNSCEIATAAAQSYSSRCSFSERQAAMIRYAGFKLPIKKRSSRRAATGAVGSCTGVGLPVKNGGPDDVRGTDRQPPDFDSKNQNAGCPCHGQIETSASASKRPRFRASVAGRDWCCTVHGQRRIRKKLVEPGPL